MDKVVLPTEADFDEFRTFCTTEDGWNEVYKDNDYKVWTRKVCSAAKVAQLCAVMDLRLDSGTLMIEPKQTALLRAS